MLQNTGEKIPREVHSTATLLLGSPNNDDCSDYTDNPNTVVIGQKVDTTANTEDGSNDEETPEASISKSRTSPKARRVSVCLEGNVIYQSNIAIGLDNSPEPRSVMVLDNISSSSFPDTGGMASEEAEDIAEGIGLLQKQPSKFLEVPTNLSDLEEEKYAVQVYHDKFTL